MPRCFVIQPFDNGAFDHRYEDVIEPAIIAAIFDPYRVDRDPAVKIPIHDIEKNIRDADCCVADITLDNPNVWYEVGYAFAREKDVVLICSKDRVKFPFDVSHRSILTYNTNSPRDFNKLGADITARLKAFARKEIRIEEISSVKPIDGLSAHELSALVVMMGDRLVPDHASMPYTIVQEMERAGYTKIATSLAFEQLEKKGFIAREEKYDGDQDTNYWSFSLTQEGVKWCLQNENLFILKDDAKRRIWKDDGEPF